MSPGRQFRIKRFLLQVHYPMQDNDIHLGPSAEAVSDRCFLAVSKTPGQPGGLYLAMILMHTD
jgi:hypothetical protein